jgi:hypothetical protein
LEFIKFEYNKQAVYNQPAKMSATTTIMIDKFDNHSNGHDNTKQYKRSSKMPRDINNEKNATGRAVNVNSHSIAKCPF